MRRRLPPPTSAAWPCASLGCGTFATAGRMKVLVVGSGGREHALCHKIAESPRLGRLLCAPGSPGIARVAECVPLKADDVSGLVALARREGIDLVVVGPEAPLALGLADALE